MTSTCDSSNLGHYARQAARYANEFRRSLGALVGIATGVLADEQLTDDEICFLDRWLSTNDGVSCCWPGNLVHARIKAALADGVISEDERRHLVETLQALVGGRLEDLAASTHVTELAFDAVETIRFGGSTFCLTGEFVYAPRDVCTKEIETRGGIVKKGVSRLLNYLIVGGLGSEEWKHGSFGTKIEEAMRCKQKGAPVLIVHEDRWAASL